MKGIHVVVMTFLAAAAFVAGFMAGGNYGNASAGLQQGQQGQAAPLLERIRPAQEGLSSMSHFTRIVTSRGGRTIHIAAIGPTDSEGNIVGIGDIEAQARQVYKKVAIALAAAGATPSDVVRQRAYVVGLTKEYAFTLKRLMAEFYAQGEAPTGLLLGIETLYDPRLMLEIEITAVVAD